MIINFDMLQSRIKADQCEGILASFLGVKGDDTAFLAPTSSDDGAVEIASSLTGRSLFDLIDGIFDAQSGPYIRRLAATACGKFERTSAGRWKMSRIDWIILAGPDTKSPGYAVYSFVRNGRKYDVAPLSGCTMPRE